MIYALYAITPCAIATFTFTIVVIVALRNHYPSRIKIPHYTLIVYGLFLRSVVQINQENK